jgi:V/A-type H+-transporting ATPase subunit I
MKRLRLFAMSDDRERLFRQLQHLGCVEVSEQTARLDDPAWSALVTQDEGELAERRAELDTVMGALKTLDQYAPVKTPLLSLRPEISEAELFRDDAKQSALEAARTICNYAAQINEGYAQLAKLTASRANLVPWEPLEVPLEVTGTDETVLLFATCPASFDLGEIQGTLAAAAEQSVLYLSSTDKDLHYFLVLTHKTQQEDALAALKTFGVSMAGFRGITGTAKENITRIDREMDALEKRIEADKTAIAARKDIRMNLKVCADRLTQDQQREQYKEKLLRTEKTFFLEGWVTAPDIPKLEAVLETYACAWELEEPAEEQYPEVPVKLKNGPLTRPLNMVTEMYSLPAYGSLDPNPLMAPFFILFYGIMMADMGYGILMMLASYIIMKKSKPNGATMRYMIPLLGLCGASTFVMGFLTGGFFGDFIPQIAKLINPNSTLELWSLFSPLDDALMVLIGSLALGLVQIFVGMGVNMYKQIKRGQVMAALCNEGAWYLIFVCIGVGIAVGQIKVGLIAALVIIVLTQGYGKKGIGGKLMGIGGSLYNNITGYFSDILSYSRLMALMLAGAVIAQVFNTLGAITGNVITFVLISMIGNALNFALNLLGCFVHDMRLQCLEFFSRFYEDGGKAFRPLEVATTYVDITQE